MQLSKSFRPIFQVLSLLLIGLAGFMVVPALVEAQMAHVMPLEFIIAACITLFFGVLFHLSSRDDKPFELSNRQGFLLTACCWVVLPLFASLPLVGVGLKGGHDITFTEAVFETVSGLTTTGSTIMSGLDSTLPGILLWRSILNWIGGIGIIVMAIILLPFLKIGGMQLFRTESSDRSEKIIPKSDKLVREIIYVYSLLTLGCAVAYWITGMSLFDAVNHAMATLATGGYSTHDASFAYFGAMSQWVAVIFMLAGGIPFITFIKYQQGKRRAFASDPQIRGFLYLLVWVIGLATVILWQRGDYSLIDSLRHAAFNVVSVVTTTGFASTDYTLWGAGAVMGFFVLTFLGGCAGSTAGGIKIYRLQVLWITLRQQLLKLYRPHQVVVLRYNGNKLPEDLVLSVQAFLVSFFAVIVIIGFLLTLMGLDFVTAISASATAVTNVGPGLGDIIGPAGNFASLPDGAKWLLCLAMIIGRLEVFTLLMLLDPNFWRD